MAKPGKALQPIDGVPMPEDAGRWNPAMLGAFRKGIAACLAGEDEDACPYRDTRKGDGRLTWSRAFIKAWEDGYRHALQHHG